MSPGLCHKCNWAQRISISTESNEIVYCTMLSVKIKQPVVKCNQFKHIGEMSLEEMKEIALHLKNDTHCAGFIWERRTKNDY